MRVLVIGGQNSSGLMWCGGWWTQGHDVTVYRVLYPYRRKAQSPQAVAYDYEKTLIEREVMNDSSMPGTVLRLPQVYGPGSNADLMTVSFFICSAVPSTSCPFCCPS